ncbi:hypothetical protein N9J58_00115 [bacterium]|nr:hypothetical protein [bacterium]
MFYIRESIDHLLIVWAHENDDNTDPMLSQIDFGTGVDALIVVLAQLVAKVTECAGEMNTDNNEPDGTIHELINIGSFAKIGGVLSSNWNKS